jgi:hypothetical protein
VPRGKEIPAWLGDVPLHCIGEIRRSKEILLVANDGRPSALPPGGYDHFRRFT